MVVGPHSGAPTPQLGRWYPPGQTSWQTSSDHLFEKNFPAGNVLLAVPCFTCHICLTCQDKSFHVSDWLLALVIIYNLNYIL